MGLDRPRGPDGRPGEPRPESFHDHLDRRDNTQPEHLATPRRALRRFVPERAALDAGFPDDVNRYLKSNMSDRPWLRPGDVPVPEVRRLFVALDRGGGHALQRHGPWVTPEMTRARVTELRDPAIADSAERRPGADVRSSDLHRCGKEATRFTDPYAFAVAVVRAVEHPDVRQALDQEFDPSKVPRAARVPLAALLGPDGHRFVDGDRLDPVEGDIERALRERRTWVQEARRGGAPTVQKPTASQIDNFKGCDVLIAFKPNREKGAYELATMYALRPA